MRFLILKTVRKYQSSEKQAADYNAQGSNLSETKKQKPNGQKLEI